MSLFEFFSLDVTIRIFIQFAGFSVNLIGQKYYKDKLEVHNGNVLQFFEETQRCYGVKKKKDEQMNLFCWQQIGVRRRNIPNP